MAISGCLGVLLLFLAISVTPSTALYGPSSDVVSLTPSNFKSTVNQGSVVLVEFFAPWCGHCKSLAPAWEKAATALKGIVTVAAVDCDAYQALAQEYGVQGFPTIKAFVSGKSPLEYSGSRDAKAIVDFALQQVKGLVSARLGGKVGGSGGGGGAGKEGPSAAVGLSSANFDEEVAQSSDIWMVEFFAPWCGHCKRLAPEWKKAANSLKGKVKLGQVDCTEEQALCAKYDVKGYPTILLFGADKESPVPYEGARTASAIEAFALETLEENVPSPGVYELTGQDVFEERCASAPICFIAFLPDILDTGAEGRNRYLEQLKTVGEKFKKHLYGYVWTAAGQQPELEQAVGVGGYGYPALVALNLKKSVFAPFKSAFQFEFLSDFIRNIRSTGVRGNEPLTLEPKVVAVELWDGLDGQLPEEEEFSLDDLMADEGSPTNEEL